MHLTFWIFVKCEGNEILLLERCSRDRVLPILPDISDYIPATKKGPISTTIQQITRSPKPKDTPIAALTAEITHITSNTLPSAVQTGSSNGVNVSLERAGKHQNPKLTRWQKHRDENWES